MSAECSLTWRAFSKHLEWMLRDLYEEDRHSDITLICEGQVQFRAHRIVLSACSPVFREIIDSNPSQHPLIYLRGIQSYELESILQFMYLGEGRFYHERMAEFLKVAKDLEVKEISDGLEMGVGKEENVYTPDDEIEETHPDPEETKNHVMTSKPKQRQPRNQIPSDDNSTQCPECGAVYCDKRTLLRHFRSKHEGIKYHCSQCDYQAKQRGDLQKHIQTKHDDNSTQCLECGVVYGDKRTLLRHYRSKHEGFKYPCNQCDYQATAQSSLQTHISERHENTPDDETKKTNSESEEQLKETKSRQIQRQPGKPKSSYDNSTKCLKCGVVYCDKGTMLKHYRSKHQGIKYPCNQCDYWSTQKSSLKTHILAKHSDTVLKCEHCSYQTKWRTNFNTHKKVHTFF